MGRANIEENARPLVLQTGRSLSGEGGRSGAERARYMVIRAFYAGKRGRVDELGPQLNDAGARVSASERKS